MERYHYREEIFFVDHSDSEFLEENNNKVIELLNNNSAVGVVGGFYDEGYPLYFISQFALKSLGYTFDEFMQMTEGKFIEAVCPEDRNFYCAGMGEEGESVREYRMQHKNGENIWIGEVRMESVAADGRRLWLSSIRVVHNEHLARREFISTISHDIRTPLNAIIGMAKLAIINTHSPERQQEYLNHVIKSGYHLLNQIGQVLDMNSIETGVMHLEDKPFHLKRFVGEIEKMFLQELTSRKQRLKVRYENVVHENLLGDKMNLQKVFINLLANASKYSADGQEIELVIIESPLQQEEYASFEIRFIDHGVGIARNMVEHIFEPFERIEDSRTTGDIPHIGLGLALTRKIVSMMGGKLSVKSRLHEGSCFMLVQKFKIQEDNHTQGKVLAVDDLTGMRVLVVEDNELNQEIMAELLGIENVETEIAANGLMAVQMFQGHEKGYYDAVLMDIHMPVMDGYDAANLIRSTVDLGGEDIPIIAVTTDAMPEDVEQELRYGMNGHMSKPINFEELKAILSFWKNKRYS